MSCGLYVMLGDVVGTIRHRHLQISNTTIMSSMDE